MSKSKQDVAKYFAALLDASPKTQETIARECGIDSANAISMMKTGKTRIPLARIPALAESLGTDAARLFEVALQAYEPELFTVYAKLAPAMLITEDEFKIVRALRSAARSGVLR